MKEIELVSNGLLYRIPNSWERLAPMQYLRLAKNLLKMQHGEMSAGEVRIRLLCDLMHWDLRKFRKEDALENLIAISEQLTFLFTIAYPDNNAVLDGLDREQREQCLRTDPFNLRLPIAEKLRKMEYRYVLDLCFCAQLIPSVSIADNTYMGYRVNTDFGQLTLSLTALQYLEARELIAQNEKTLPLMAAILYYPGQYNSEGAHTMAKEFAKLPAHTLHAISWNFQALNNFLFTRTSFSLLTKFKERTPSPITTDASDALYDLSADGLGNNSEVEQMNVLTYLRILRKKTIDSVRQMRGMEMDVAKISIETGLPIEVINDII